MRWFGVALLLLSCESSVVEAPPAEEIGEDLEHCGDFVEEDERPVSDLAADEALPARPVSVGIMRVEPVEVPSAPFERVPLERGDLDTSPLPRCQLWPACLEALVRDKPLSGRTQVGLWIFDGHRLTAAAATRGLAGPLDGVVIADLPRGVLYEPAARGLTRVTTDGARLQVCTGDETASDCQTLDLSHGVVELRLGTP